jgi:hypothetical protein
MLSYTLASNIMDAIGVAPSYVAELTTSLRLVLYSGPPQWSSGCEAHWSLRLSLEPSEATYANWDNHRV